LQIEDPVLALSFDMAAVVALRRAVEDETPHNRVEL